MVGASAGDLDFVIGRNSFVSCGILGPLDKGK